MGKKYLADAHYVSNWTSLVGALEGTLRFLGSDLSTAYLMGVTGHAFRLAVVDGPDGVVGAGGPARADYERALPLYQGIGWEVEYLYTYADRDPKYPHHRSEAIKRIQSSIDKGRPVVAYGLHLPEFGIIKGYDSRARTFAVSTQVTPQYGEALPYDQWPVPGREQAVRVFLVGRPRRIDRREAELRALRFAVQYAEEGEPTLGPAVATGLAAYRRWLEALEGDEPISPAGHAQTIHAVHAARAQAGRFLREIAPDYPPAVAVAMKEAASAYDRTLLPFSRLVSMFPYPAGGHVENTAMRRAAVLHVREARMQEDAAVRHLKEALRQA